MVLAKTLGVSIAFGAVLLTAGTGGHAQDISPVFDMAGLANTASMGAVINSERARAARMGAPTMRGMPMPPPGRAFMRPAPPAAATVSMRYSAPPALRQDVVSEFVDRVRRHSPENARLIQAQLAQHDYRRIYDEIVRPYGLAGDDAANALAAYIVLGWMIVHDGQAPPPDAVRGVRAQASVALTDSRLSSVEMHARLGEEFKILFVTVHAGWQSARREGNLGRYAAGVADMFRNLDGIDLRAMDLGPAGFQAG